MCGDRPPAVYSAAVKRAALGLVLLCGVLLTPDCRGRQEASPEPAPLQGRDMILVVADSLDAAHLGTYGYSRPTAPFLTEVAEAGVTLERAISQTSWTLSSVVSLMTGLEQEAHGVMQIEQSLPADRLSTLGELFQSKGYRTVGLVQNAVIGEGTGLERGFDRYDYMRFTEEGAEDLVRAVGEEAAASARDQPLFMYVHVGPPHMPYRPPEPFRSRFAGGAPESRVVGSIRDTTDIMVEKSAPSHPDVIRLVELYDGHVAYADSVIRRSVEAFESEGRAGSPVLLVTADHGEAFMQHGAVGHNLFCYEPMVRVPWIIAAPGTLPAGLRVPGTGSLLDVLPTLAELFGLPSPDHRTSGVSLAPQLLGDGPIRDRPLLISSRYPQPGKEAQLGLVEGSWKLVLRRRGQPAQLFNTAEDPDELVDVLGVHPERAARMRATLEERRAEVRGSRASARRELPSSVLRELDALGYGGQDRDGGQRRSVERR